MQLHIINQSPYSSSALDDAITAAAPHDTLLLIDDGVYALSNQDHIIDITKHKNLVLKALDDSCKPRGITCKNKALQISMKDMVDLTLQAQHCISWF